MSPYALLAAVIAIVAAVGGAGYQGYRMGRDAQIARHAQAEALVRESREAMLQAAAEAIADIQIRHTTIRQPIEREIRENVVYRDCRHSPDALGLLNAALQDGGAEPARGGELPTTDAAR